MKKPYQAIIDSIQLNWLKKQKQISEPWMDLMLLAVKGAMHYNEKDNLKQLQEIWNGVDDGHKTSIKGKNISNILYPSYSCKPCVAAKKELDSMISSGDCSVEVVGLNLDTETVWKSKGKDNPVLWHDFNDLKGSRGFNTRFKTQGIPTFVIVSKE